MKNTNDVTLEDLLHMQKSLKTNFKKLGVIKEAIHNHLNPLYVWGCQPLTNANERRVKVLLQCLHCTATWVHMQITQSQHQQLVDKVIAFHGSMAWVSIFKIPMVFD